MGQFDLPPLAPVSFERPTLQLASVINEIPSNRPVMWGRYAWARVSPLNSIETTSVSTMAAFIVGWLVRFLLDATRADLRRIPLPTRLQASVLPAEFQSRQWVSRPVERPVPRRKAGGVLRSRRLDSLCSLVHESRITGHRPLALRHHGLVSCPAFTRSTLCQIGASSTPSYSSRQTYLLVASSINSRAEIVGLAVTSTGLHGFLATPVR